jgi:uncharacterized protein (TIGR02118 family)
VAYRAVSTWSRPKPELVDEFERYYLDVHAPFAARVPGVLKLVLTRTIDGLESTPSAFYRAVDVWFADKAAFETAIRTKEWAELRRDAAYAQEHFGVSLLTGLGEVAEVKLDPGGPRPSGSRISDGG